jgi:[ribosomal protein S18]-alanine N-acetyltransferase
MSFDPAEIEIRRLAENDLSGVVDLAQTLPEAPDWPRQLYEEALRADCPRPRIGLVAGDHRSGEVIGFAIASLIPPEAELESIAVAAHAQRHGVGGRLLAALIGELRQGGAEELLLEVRASNLQALRFYTAKNFKQTGVRIRYYAHPQEDAVLFSLRLISPVQPV